MKTWTFGISFLPAAIMFINSLWGWKSILSPLVLLLVCGYVMNEEEKCQPYIDCRPTLILYNMGPTLEDLCAYRNYHLEFIVLRAKVLSNCSILKSSFAWKDEFWSAFSSSNLEEYTTDPRTLFVAFNEVGKEESSFQISEHEQASGIHVVTVNVTVQMETRVYHLNHVGYFYLSCDSSSSCEILDALSFNFFSILGKNVERNCAGMEFRVQDSSKIAGKELEFEIKCLWNCNPVESWILEAFDPHLDSVLVAVIHGEQQPQEFRWSVFSCSYFSRNLEASCDELVFENAGSYKLLIPTSKWNPEGGETYKISFSGQFSDRTVESACTFLTVNAVPTGGSCSVAPISGVAGMTDFTFGCIGFKDANSPLLYRYFIQKNTTIDQRGYLMDGGTEVSQVQNIFNSSGAVENSFRVTFEVEDSLGAIKQLWHLFEVLPQRAIKEVKEISNAINEIKNVLSSDDEKDDVLDIVSDAVNESKMDNWLNGTEREVTVLLETITSTVNTDQARTNPKGPENEDKRKVQRSEVREAVINTLTKVNVTENIFQMQQIGTILNNITTVQEEVTGNAQNQASEVYSNLATSLKNTARTSSKEIVKETASVLLTGAIHLLGLSGRSGKKLVEQKKSLEHTKEEPVRKKSVKQAKSTSKNLLKTVEQAADVVLATQEVGASPTVFETEEMSMEIQALDPEQLAGKTIQKNQTNNETELVSTFQFPNTSLDTILGTGSNTSEGIGIQVIFSKKNPYFWSEDSSSVTTSVMNLKLKDLTSQDDIAVKNLTEPLTLTFSNSQTAENATSSMVSLEVPLNVSESVAKITPSLRGMAVFNITRPATKTGSYILSIVKEVVPLPIKVLVQGESMPRLEDILKTGTRLPENNSLPLSQQMQQENDSRISIPFSLVDKYRVVHVGIAVDEVETEDGNLVAELLELGGDYCMKVCAESTVVNCTSTCHGDLKISMNITLSTYSVACMYWVDEEQSWSQEGCTVAPQTTENAVQCLCTHLTAFSGGFFVVPNLINPFDDLKYFSSFFSNPIVVNTVLIVWIFYLTILYWARQEDKKDLSLSKVYVLPDNNPADLYQYLICVVTHWGQGAGTTANIFIQLKGNRDYSSKRCLMDVTREFFKSGTEDWFLLATPNSLGELKSLDLWHDSSGLAPSWSLNQILVKDLQMKKSWIFFFDNWLAADRGLLRTNVSLKAAPLVRRHKYRKSNFFLQSSRDMRNHHLWIGIFKKPAFSHFTRAQRLSCALCLVLTTMLTNIMFQGIPTDDPEDQLKLGEVSVSLTVIAIGIESSLIMFPINIMIALFFDKAKVRPSELIPLPKLVFGETTTQTKMLEPSDGKIQKKEQEGNKSNNSEKENVKEEETVYEDEDEDVTQIGKCLPWWFIYVGWFLAMTISLICSFFVMLYGLKYGYRKSVDWLVSSLVAVVQSAMVTQPVKVICIAILLTVILKKPVEIEKEKTQRDIDQYGVYTDDLSKTTSFKKQTILNPLSEESEEKCRHKLKTYNKVSYAFSNILLFVTMLVIVLIIVYGYKPITTSYYCNKAVEDMFISAIHKTNSLALNQVKTVDMFWKYLYVTVVPVLAELGGDELSLTPYNNYYIVGPYRLRQSRVKNDSCVLPYSGLLGGLSRSYCIYPQWHRQVDDTSHYTDTWAHSYNETSPDWYDAWKYQSGIQLETYSYSGNHATYQGGGYVFTLAANQSEEETLQNFQNSDWIDEKTRAVFLEFTLYNPNVDLFTKVVILFEFTCYGNLDPMFEVYTAKLRLIHKRSILEVLTAMSHVLFLLITLLQTYIEVNRYRYLNKKRDYFKKLWTYVNILQLIFSYNILLYFLQRVISMNRISRNYVESSGLRFVSFNTLMHLDQILGQTLIALLSIMFFRVSKFFEFNKRLLPFFILLNMSKYRLLAVLLFLTPVIIAFTSISYLRYGKTFGDYRSFFTTFYNLFAQVFRLSSHKEKDHTIFSRIIVFTFAFLFRWIMMSVFTVIMIFYISKLKKTIKVARPTSFSKVFWKRIYAFFRFEEFEEDSTDHDKC